MIINIRNQILVGLILLFLPAIIVAQGSNFPLVRPKPKQVCVLKNKDLRITFDKTDGLPYQYELLKIKESFWGENNGKKIEVVVRKLSDRSETKSVATISSTNIKEGKVRFRYNLNFNGADVGSFEICYALQNTTVFVTLENVSETNEYHLIEVITNNLVTLRQEDGSSSFVYNSQAGKLVDLASAKPGDIGDDNGYFGGYPNISVLPVVVFIKPNAFCSMEIQGYCNKTVLDVMNQSGNNRAMIGSVTPHYQRGGENTPDLIIHQNNICRIDFGGDYDKNGKTDWLDAAKTIRGYMPEIRTNFYDDKYMWIIHGQVGRHEVETTFEEVGQLVKRISSLIDNNPQICYVSGWCEGGHDTGYPNVTKINSLLGGESAFAKLITEAKKSYNTTVSFDDNYDDQYNNEFTSGFFDLDNIAKNAEGKPMTFHTWNGKDMSHITGMAHYMRPGGPGEARVDYTATKYGIENTLLIDAATWWTVRPDYDSNHPASAPTNWNEGKVKLFDRFQKKHGINITSELLRYPAVGQVAMVCDGPHPEGGNQYGGAGTDIPFLSVAYRKSVYYGCPGGKQDPNSIRNLLYNNNKRQGWLNKNVADSFITDIYYTNYIPWFRMHKLDVLSFVRNGKTVEMELSENSSIFLSPELVVAKYQGNTIISNNDITCPVDEHRIAFYSQSDKMLSYPLPKGVEKSSVKAVALYADRRVDVPVSIVDGQITVNVFKQVPVIVYL